MLLERLSYFLTYWSNEKLPFSKLQFNKKESKYIVMQTC